MRILKDGIALARFPQPPQREKQHAKKISQFHAWQNFLFVQKAGNGGCRGDNICKLRYVAVFSGLLCVMGLRHSPLNE